MNSPEIRAGDADRDRVIEQLREAYAEGRLTNEELNERIEAAHAATMQSDLVPLTADLPVPVSTRESTPAPKRAKADTDLRAAWAAWLGVGVLMNVIWVGTWLAGSGSPTYYWPIWVIGPWGAGMLIAQLSRRFTRE